DKDIIKTNDADMRAGKSIQHESRIRNSDNSIHWIETKITPTLNDKGILVRIDGLVSDITERKESEEKLKQIENRFRDIFNSAPESIVIIDISTVRFTKFNEN